MKRVSRFLLAAVFAVTCFAVLAAPVEAFHPFGYRQRVVVQQVVVRQRVVVAQPVVQAFVAQPLYSQAIVQPVQSYAPVVQQVVTPGCQAFFVR